VNRLWVLTRRYGLDVLIVVAALESALEVAFRDAADEPQSTPWFAVPAVALVVLLLLGRRRFPFAAPALFWLVGAAFSLVDGRLLVFPTGLFVAGMAASFLLGNLRDELQTRLGLAVVVGCASIVLYDKPNHTPGELVFLPVLFAIAWLAGFALRERAQQAEAAEVRATQAEREREAAARIAVAEERARIARELHDIVAHHLAVIVIQAGAGRIATDEDGVGERCGVIRCSGEEALAEMSRLVALLQPDARGVGEGWALEPLLAHAQAAGLQVRSVELSDARLRPELGQLAYRIVQEGLTNAMKHAPGSMVRLRVAVEDGALEIELHDDSGDAPGTLSGTGSGLGLEGLRERTESLGGSLDAGEAIEGGWRLRARIPTGEVTAVSPSKG
jgi:signal transduction histidine kinase